ncbi:SPOR domain-containing protein [Stutzerimonas kirkiae]|uniref:Cell division protein n=1 Tax=Stutzerimonas kirkiae TaxID=2211392 RepID=A0A4Q9R9D1_9GAMM|nr:SPOR domain-containing protein [Stutzerimonas kirkiae]TBU97269.1 cell division protein [Stutzerimonas kirkiae]TBV03692.1 cell division protein [Stutzerimonas kirkiae]TBV11314.1 cell division protein [Stutzerimonas kirkiae]TBV13437.1 cell division protein [Stutzerimonas kirkiae]
MALLDRGLIQRIVGALVLVALAVIFVPMLFNREDESRPIPVEAPPMPTASTAPEIEMQAVEVPEPVAESYEIIDEAPASAPVQESTETPATVTEPVVAPSEQPKAAAAPEKPAEPRLDASNLPVSWSVQLASLSNRASAENLQKTLRAQGYNAYIRTSGNMNRVFVGPLIERAEANRLRDQLQRQHKLDGFVVRFEPEKR